jgi:hypothetical protein
MEFAIEALFDFDAQAANVDVLPLVCVGLDLHAALLKKHADELLDALKH